MSESEAGGSEHYDPHINDYCIICLRGVRTGVPMYPVAGIENGCVCEECNNAGRSCDNEIHNHLDAAIVYDDGSAWCEDCHQANVDAAASVREDS